MDRGRGLQWRSSGIGDSGVRRTCGLEGAALIGKHFVDDGSRFPMDWAGVARAAQLNVVAMCAGRDGRRAALLVGSVRLPGLAGVFRAYQLLPLDCFPGGWSYG